MKAIAERWANDVSHAGLVGREKLNAMEVYQAVRLSEHLRRRVNMVVSTEERGDAVDATGQVYDFVGPSLPMSHPGYNGYKFQQVMCQIINHNCGKDEVRQIVGDLRTVVFTTNLSASEVDTVHDLLDCLSSLPDVQPLENFRSQHGLTCKGPAGEKLQRALNDGVCLEDAGNVIVLN